MPQYVCKYCEKTTDAYRPNYRHNMTCKKRGGDPKSGDRKPLVKCSFCSFIGPSAREVKAHEETCDDGPSVLKETPELPEEAKPEAPKAGGGSSGTPKKPKSKRKSRAKKSKK